MPTLLEVLRLSTTYLAQRGSESARLDAEVLTAHSLGLRRLDLYLQYDRPMREEELQPIREMLRRRAAGEPVAYLVGEREFYGRTFKVTPAVLIPRPDTEALVEAALRWARARGGELTIADVGTGSGCIAITMAAELERAHVVASDVSEDALAVALGNAERLGVSERVAFVHGSWDEPLRERAPFDMVLSNPPYVTAEEMQELARDVREFEPHLALTARDGDGLESYRALFGAVPGLVRGDAYVAVEVDPRRAEAVKDMASEAFRDAEVRCVRDLTDRDRVVEVLLR